MPLSDLSKLTDIQSAIDAEVARRGLLQYAEYYKYVPQGQTPPEDATHVLELVSLRTKEAIVIAIKGRGFYTAIADSLLAAL